MTKVNVTTQNNTVEVTDSTGTSVVTSPVTTTVTASTIGPQGPQGVAGSGGITISDSGKVDLSVVYWDSSAETYKADATWTISTLVVGGSF
jgi:hypothetical protein